MPLEKFQLDDLLTLHFSGRERTEKLDLRRQARSERPDFRAGCRGGGRTLPRAGKIGKERRSLAAKEAMAMRRAITGGGQEGLVAGLDGWAAVGQPVVVDRAPKNGARASPEPLVLFTRARASLGSSPTQTSP
jgi:hypothetical protein